MTSPSDLRATVRTKYAAVARGESLSCCGDPSRGDAGALNMIGDAYDGVAGHVPAADLGLGCGLPVAHTVLAPGHTVLDLGSGAGIDAFVARREVGEAGRVVGVDFTPEMTARARANAAALGHTNVEFLDGEIEALPLPDASVDVVVSNCVLNLVPEKAGAFAEMRRVLRPGGHFCVSDIVSVGHVPAAVRGSAELFAGCMAGAMDRDAHLALLRETSFEAVEVVAERRIAIPDAALPPLSDADLAAWHAGGLASVTVRGVRPRAASAEPVTLRVFDPPQCCATGVCGPDPDAALLQFAADLRAVEATGVAVVRANLAQEAEVFLAEPLVADAVNARGTAVLPLIVAGGRIVSEGRYPPRDELLAYAAGSSPGASAAGAGDFVPLGLAPSRCC